MAQKGVQVDRETITCSICLDLLKDPVAIPCGHSYCMNCIKSHFDEEDRKKIHSCPQCRKIFIPRPVLVKNIVLADLVEQLKKTGLQATPADHCYAGPEDVACDVCTGRKLKAIKSCLVCLASYCEKHFQPHYDAAPLKKHKLVAPSKKLQENICSRHDEVMKIFCRTDQQSICYLCTMDEHKGHETVPAAAERTEKQKELKVRRLNIQQRIQEREKDVKLLQQEVEAINGSADKAVEDSEKMFTELIRLIQKRSSDENICSRHDEVMKIFCRTDQQSICYLCTMDEHKGHETVPAAAERTEKQKELEVRRLNIQQRIQEREKDVKLLQQEVEAINGSADKAVEDSEKMFTELIRLIQKRSSDVKQQVRSQQETEVSRVKELQEKLEQEIAELKRKDGELEQLSHTEDHNQFLHNYPSLSALSESTHSSSINIRPLRYFEDVTAAVSETRDKLQDILREEWTNISLTVTEVDVLLSPPEPKTRAGFLKYSHEVTLDPNTANTHLLLSEGNRKATFMKQQQSYSDHPDRFTVWPQVLSRESLTGRCYWEVEWRGEAVFIAVTYKNISREGESTECAIGANNKSWGLRCDNNSYIFLHNNVQTVLSGPRSSRVGVYLDHRAGILSFYSVSETMTLLHRVQTTFTQPLYAGLLFFEGVSAEFIKLK
uniref:Tripartite motif containing 16 n=1 Tax=Oreochromis niloticus TaxID=8128 RepID=I3K0S9_ORENI